MVVLVVIAVPLVLLLAWAVAFDLKQRRQRAPLSDHDARGVARHTRTTAEGTGTEWGAGL